MKKTVKKYQPGGPTPVVNTDVARENPTKKPGIVQKIKQKRQSKSKSDFIKSLTPMSPLNGPPAPVEKPKVYVYKPTKPIETKKKGGATKKKK